MLQELGPTFVKFGQMVASRSEVLPADWQAELEQLQDDVAPFSYGEVEQVIRRELGRGPDEVFAAFDKTPLAAASTAQVHAATLVSGERVVVKVLRPDIEVTVKGDLNVMQDALNLIERRVPWTRRFGVSSLFREFATNVLTELDLENEAYSARLLRHNLRDFPSAQVPVIYGPYSTAKVLTQERVAGVKITDADALDAAGLDREALAITFFRALLQQVIFDGFFHADPHPGNVWVNLETGRIIFLDMGMMGYLALEDRIALGELIWALQDRDASSVTRVLLTMSKGAPIRESALLQRDIERLINHNLLFSDAPPSLTLIMSQIVDVLVRHGLQLRHQFTLAVKAIGQGESIMRGLMGDKPADYILEVTYGQLKELLREQLAPGDVLDRAAKPLAREFLGRLPALRNAATTLLDDFQKGELAFQMTGNGLDERMETVRTAVESGVRRVVMSVLLVGLLLGSTLTLLLPLEGKVSATESLLIYRVAELGFTIGALLIISMLFLALGQSLRKQKEA
jgi:ubiquinone biosynthesis protein